MSIVAIIQARMGSTRLAGKVMLPLAGAPMLQRDIERLQTISLLDRIVVATTTLDEDTPIVELCTQLGIDTWRGSAEDVLSRYHGAAQAFHADIIVRITSDCPLISASVSSQSIAAFLAEPVDYLCNTFQRRWPRGLDTEVFHWAALDRAFKEGHQRHEREHVTPYIYQHPEQFRLGSLVGPRDLSAYRWTVDTIEDYRLVSLIYDALYAENPAFEVDDILNLLALHPDWSEINEAIRQKEL